MARRPPLLITLPAAVLAVLVTASGALARTGASDGWLGTVNAYRASAGLAPVEENATWSADALAHSRYLVDNDVVSHEEDPDLPGATLGGAIAGANGNVAGTGAASRTDEAFVELWMAGPFHAIGILRPDLESVGYGAHRDDDAGDIRAAATLDVVRGIDPDRAGTDEPVVWPGDGSVVPLREYPGNELPDPVTACPGYSPPTGLPILVLLPDDAVDVTSSGIDVDGRRVAHCRITAESYTHPVQRWEDRGRALLAADNATILVARDPFEDGDRVSVELGAAPYDLRWSFDIGSPSGEILPADDVLR
ncbi:MAG: CAP domain-containing protein [Actinomycetota bacterium]|nr:CAP domain-containing protein [Actinomycetota bacterium]